MLAFCALSFVCSFSLSVLESASLVCPSVAFLLAQALAFTMVADGAENEDGAVYCKYCDMWLNGPSQWEDHKLGKKHRKATRVWRLREFMEHARRDPPGGDPAQRATRG